MINLTNVSVTFSGKKEVQAVKHVNLTVEQGDIFGIVGYSGAGKSTLVRVINFLQKPTQGTVTIDGRCLNDLHAKELRAERKKIGMIFQHFNLMESRTIFHNVAFALKYSKKTKEEINEKVTSLLELVGLKDKANSYPSQLSGGQKQRVAIARALVNEPQILLCDEATSALDPKTTAQILALLKHLNQTLGLTMVIITHEMQVVKEICHKVAVMENGEVVETNSSLNIFSSPKKALTQEFIRTATHVDQALERILSQPKFSQLADNESLIELSYVGDKTSKPLISRLFSKYQVSANILYGNVEIIQDEPIGTLIVTLKGATKQREQAIHYLKSQHVTVRLLKEKQSISWRKIEGGQG